MAHDGHPHPGFDRDRDDADSEKIMRLSSPAELSRFSATLTRLDVTGNGVLEVIDVSALPPGLTHVTCAGCVNLKELRLGQGGLNLTHLDCHACPKLHRVELRCTPLLEYLDCSLSQVRCSRLDLARVPELKHLAVRGNHGSSLDLSHVPRLTHLSCSECLDLKRLDLACVPNLTHLDCQLCDIPVITLHPDLTYLDCSCNSALRSLDLARAPGLTFLDCSGCDALEASSLDFGAVPDLKHLDFADSAKLAGSLLDLSPLTKLTSLDVARHAGGSITGELLGTMKCLEHLDCFKCAGLPASLSFLRDMSALRELRLGGDPSIGEVPLAGLSGLRSLRVSQCPGLSRLDLAAVGGLTQLEIFHCPALEAVEVCLAPQLEILSIWGCPGMRNLSRVVLADLPKLQRLSINQAPWLKVLDVGHAKELVLLSCTHTGLEHVHVTQAPKLDTLCIEEAPGYNDDKLDLAAMPALTLLTCNGCPWLKWIYAGPNLRNIICTGCVNLSGIRLS